MIGNHQQDTKLGPGCYNAENSIDFFASSQSHNVKNKMLFQEMRKIQQKSETEIKLLYQSRVIKTLLDSYDATPKKSAILSSQGEKLSPNTNRMIKNAKERHSLRSFNYSTKQGRKSNTDVSPNSKTSSPMSNRKELKTGK